MHEVFSNSPSEIVDDRKGCTSISVLMPSAKGDKFSVLSLNIESTTHLSLFPSPSKSETTSRFNSTDGRFNKLKIEKLDDLDE